MPLHKSQIFMHIIFLRFKILLGVCLQCHCWAWVHFKNIFCLKCQFCEFSISPESPNYRFCIQLKPRNQRWTLLSVALIVKWDGISDNMPYFLMRRHLQQPCKEKSRLPPNWNNLCNCCCLMEITRTQIQQPLFPLFVPVLISFTAPSGFTWYDGLPRSVSVPQNALADC